MQVNRVLERDVFYDPLFLRFVSFRNENIKL